MTGSEVESLDERAEEFLAVEESVRREVAGDVAGAGEEDRGFVRGPVVSSELGEWEELRESEQAWMVERERARGNVPEGYVEGIVMQRSYVVFGVEADGRVYRAVLEVLPGDEYSGSQLDELVRECGGSEGEVSALNERVVSLWSVDRYDGVWLVERLSEREREWVVSGLVEWDGQQQQHLLTDVGDLVLTGWIAVCMGTYLLFLMGWMRLLDAYGSPFSEFTGLGGGQESFLLLVFVMVTLFGPLAVVVLVHKLVSDVLFRKAGRLYQLVTGS